MVIPNGEVPFVLFVFYCVCCFGFHNLYITDSMFSLCYGSESKGSGHMSQCKVEIVI